MAKQYTTNELMKAWREGERGKFRSNNNINPVELKDDGIYFSRGERYFISLGDVLWTKVQEPVTFVEAINSGKRIKPEPNCLNYNRCTWWLRHIADCYPADRVREILNGKWLIEDKNE